MRREKIKGCRASYTASRNNVTHHVVQVGIVTALQHSSMKTPCQAIKHAGIFESPIEPRLKKGATTQLMDLLQRSHTTTSKRAFGNSVEFATSDSWPHANSSTSTSTPATATSHPIDSQCAKPLSSYLPSSLKSQYAKPLTTQCNAPSTTRSHHYLCYVPPCCSLRQLEVRGPWHFCYGIP